MAFEQKTWYNDGILPDDAPEGTVAPCLDTENLNRIEKGIADSLQKTGGVMDGVLLLHSNPVSEMEAATKKYVDENNLLFSGNLNLPAVSATINVSYALPSDLDLSKYVGIFSVPSANDSAGGDDENTVLLPPNSNRTVTYTDNWRYINVKINTSTNTLQFSGSTTEKLGFSSSFSLLLVPVLNKGAISTI